MLNSMSMQDVPSFISHMLKQKADDLQWDLYIHRYDGDLSFVEFKKELQRGQGSGLTAAEKIENEKEALDFASQFITFAQPEKT